jgi:hypothetical protein
MNKRYVGSNFDEFLEEEDLLAEAEAVALKQVIAFQVVKFYWFRVEKNFSLRSR